MEELLHHPILTLTLAHSFDVQQWKVITREKPQVYQQEIAAISKILDRNIPQFTVQYYKFMQNQVTLKNWYHSQQHLQSIIQPYLFRFQPQTQLQLSSNTIHSNKIYRTEPSAVRNYFAQTTGGPDIPDDLALGPVSNYELYLSTLSACRGKKYAAYDYQKHMKNSKEKKRYNECIRMNHKRNVSNPMTRSNKLYKFQQFKPKLSKKTSLVNFRGILQDIKLNNEKGLHKMLKKQGTQKLVLINHQRKPINYYLSQSSKKQNFFH